MKRISYFINEMTFCTACAVMGLSLFANGGGELFRGSELVAAFFAAVALSVTAIGFGVRWLLMPSDSSKKSAFLLDSAYYVLCFFLFFALYSLPVSAMEFVYLIPFFLYGAVLFRGAGSDYGVFTGVSAGSVCAVLYGANSAFFMDVFALTGLIILLYRVLSSRLFSGFGKVLLFLMAAIPLCIAALLVPRHPPERDYFDSYGIDASAYGDISRASPGSEILGAYLQQKPSLHRRAFFFVPLYSEGHVFYSFLSLERPEGAVPRGHSAKAFRDGAFVPPEGFFESVSGDVVSDAVESCNASDLSSGGFHKFQFKMPESVLKNFVRADFIRVELPPPDTLARNYFFTREFFQRVKSEMMSGAESVISVSTHGFSNEAETVLANTLLSVFKRVIVTEGAARSLVASDSDYLSCEASELHSRLASACALMETEGDAKRAERIRTLAMYIPECREAVADESGVNSFFMPRILYSVLGEYANSHLPACFSSILQAVYDVRYIVLCVFVSVYLAMRYFIAFHTHNLFAFASFEHGASLGVFAFACAFGSAYACGGFGFINAVLFFLSGAVFACMICGVWKGSRSYIIPLLCGLVFMMYLICIKHVAVPYLSFAAGFFLAPSVFHSAAKMLCGDPEARAVVIFNILCGLCAGTLFSVIFSFDLTGLLVLCCIFGLKGILLFAKSANGMYFKTRHDARRIHNNGGDNG